MIATDGNLCAKQAAKGTRSLKASLFTAPTITLLVILVVLAQLLTSTGTVPGLTAGDQEYRDFYHVFVWRRQPAAKSAVQLENLNGVVHPQGNQLNIASTLGSTHTRNHRQTGGLRSYQDVAPAGSTANTIDTAGDATNSQDRYTATFRCKDSIYQLERNSTTDNFSCKFCNNRDARLANIANVDIERLVWDERKSIRLANSSPEGSRPFVVCLVAKNGSSQWKRLLLKLRGKDYLVGQQGLHAPRNFYDLSNLPKLMATRLLRDKDIPMIFISRNPYVRVLSGYLDKSSKGTGHNDPALSPYVGTDRGIYAKLRRHYGTYTFDGFVKTLYQLHQILTRRGLAFSKSNMVNRHFASQSTFCGLPAGLVYDYVLKVEQVNEWYDGLVGELNLGRVVAHGWPGENDCFLSTTRNACAGTVAQVDDFGGIAFHAQGVGSEHNQEANERLLKYFTPELVALVNEIYADDFKTFGYPVWDGYGHPSLS